MPAGGRQQARGGWAEQAGSCPGRAARSALAATRLGGAGEPAMANTVKQEPTPLSALRLRVRAGAGLTQERLGARAGLSSNAISALESGKRRTPRFATVELLAAALALDGQQRNELVAAARSTAGGAGGAVATGAAPTVSGAEPGTGGRSATARDPRRQFWRSVAEPTPLVDRVHELDTTLRLLGGEGVRLLTLTGPAGVGKTRLALEAAARFATDRDPFPAGGALVHLTPKRAPALLPNRPPPPLLLPAPANP